MRVLFTVQPSSGHLRPLVPLARAVSHRGHEVAVCSAPSFRTEVEAYGLTHIGAGLDWTNSGPSAELPPPGPEFEKFIVRMFADITTRSMVPDLMDVADAWRPDLIVRESLEYGGCLVAEALGIPHASVAGNGYSAVDSPEVTHFPGNRRMVARAMARHRAELALPADPDHAMPFRHLHLCFTPPEWDGVDAPRPANSQFLRHENATRPGTSMPEWMTELPERPTVLASLGTIFNTTSGLLEAIIGGLANEPVNLIVAIGRDQDKARFGPVPANVRLEHHVPQAELLPLCAAFVTHGGFNSVKESLVAGVPMVVIPITADQPYCAQRCAALGVAEVIGPEQRTPDHVRAATHAVLTADDYRANAETFRNKMLALPSSDHAVELLERLASTKRHP